MRAHSNYGREHLLNVQQTWRALNILEYTFAIGVPYHEDTHEETDSISNKSTFTLSIIENAMKSKDARIKVQTTTQVAP